MGKAARLKRERQGQRVTVEQLRELELDLLAALRYDHDCSLTLVRCEACDTVQSNWKDLPCALCRAGVATYA